MSLEYFQLIGGSKLPDTVDEKTWRKQRPLFSGVLRYFPDALLEVAHTSFVGNEQHNAGQPLHWAKEKSTDEYDALLRHLKDVGTRDTDGVRHAAKVAWRALAGLQREIDAEKAKTEPEMPVEPGVIIPWFPGNESKEEATVRYNNSPGTITYKQ